jgi:hypothetical protein
MMSQTSKRLRLSLYCPVCKIRLNRKRHLCFPEHLQNNANMILDLLCSGRITTVQFRMPGKYHYAKLYFDSDPSKPVHFGKTFVDRKEAEYFDSETAQSIFHQENKRPLSKEQFDQRVKCQGIENLLPSEAEFGIPCDCWCCNNGYRWKCDRRSLPVSVQRWEERYHRPFTYDDYLLRFKDPVSDVYELSDDEEFEGHMGGTRRRRRRGKQMHSAGIGAVLESVEPVIKNFTVNQIPRWNGAQPITRKVRTNFYGDGSTTLLITPSIVVANDCQGYNVNPPRFGQIRFKAFHIYVFVDNNQQLTESEVQVILNDGANNYRFFVSPVPGARVAACRIRPSLNLLGTSFLTTATTTLLSFSPPVPKGVCVLVDSTCTQF